MQAQRRREAEEERKKNEKEVRKKNEKGEGVKKGEGRVESARESMATMSELGR